MTDWERDCIREHGRILTGQYRHWCYDWDDMPIDETCPEFGVCGCAFDVDDLDSLAQARGAALEAER